MSDVLQPNPQEEVARLRVALEEMLADCDFWGGGPEVQGQEYKPRDLKTQEERRAWRLGYDCRSAQIANECREALGLPLKPVKEEGAV